MDDAHDVHGTGVSPVGAVLHETGGDWVVSSDNTPNADPERERQHPERDREFAEDSSTVSRQKERHLYEVSTLEHNHRRSSSTASPASRTISAFRKSFSPQFGNERPVPLSNGLNTADEASALQRGKVAKHDTGSVDDRAARCGHRVCGRRIEELQAQLKDCESGRNFKDLKRMMTPEALEKQARMSDPCQLFPYLGGTCCHFFNPYDFDAKLADVLYEWDRGWFQIMSSARTRSSVTVLRRNYVVYCSCSSDPCVEQMRSWFSPVAGQGLSEKISKSCPDASAIGPATHQSAAELCVLLLQQPESTVITRASPPRPLSVPQNEHELHDGTGARSELVVFRDAPRARNHRFPPRPHHGGDHAQFQFRKVAGCPRLPAWRGRSAVGIEKMEFGDSSTCGGRRIRAPQARHRGRHDGAGQRVPWPQRAEQRSEGSGTGPGNVHRRGCLEPAFAQTKQIRGPGRVRVGGATFWAARGAVKLSLHVGGRVVRGRRLGRCCRLAMAGRSCVDARVTMSVGDLV